MSLDCVIQVRGTNDGAGGNGRPKNTLTGAVYRFIRDSQHYYQAVFTHLKECQVCDPQEALELFLKNREGKKKRGHTSRMLLEMSERYKRHFGDRVSDALVKEYLVRGLGCWELFVERIDRLEREDLDRAVAIQFDGWVDEMRGLIPKLKEMIRADPNPRVVIGRMNDTPYDRLRRQILEDGHSGPKVTIVRDAVEGRWRDSLAAAGAGDPIIEQFLRAYDVWTVLEG